MVAEATGGLRRVVPSPKFLAILNIAPIRPLVQAGVCVICACSGGFPVVRERNGQMEGVEAVIDKDFTAALLAKALKADILLMFKGVEAVFSDWGGQNQMAIGAITPDELDEMSFAAGSVGPKISSACSFVRAGGLMAGIGCLQDARAIVEDQKGTRVSLDPLALKNQGPSNINPAFLQKHQPAQVPNNL